MKSEHLKDDLIDIALMLGGILLYLADIVILTLIVYATGHWILGVW